MLSVSTKLCSFNTDVPPELLSYILSRCPLNHTDLPAEFNCHCQGASIDYDPPGEPPLKLAGCIWPRDRAGRILEIKPVEKTKLPKEPKPTNDLPGQQKLFQTTANDQQSTSIQEPEPMTATAAPAAPVQSAAAATAATPANVTPVAVKKLPPLWAEGIEIPFIGLTAEHEGGKTLFILFICPGSVLIWDTEFSSEPYQIGLKLIVVKTKEQFAAAMKGTGSVRVDLPSIMASMYPGKEFKAIDRFMVWLELAKQVPPGRFRVQGLDCISEIEMGLTDAIKANPARFGYTKNQLDNSTPLLQSAANDYWKQILSGLMTTCETFVASAHMRNKFVGGRPSNIRESKGRSTIMELATLYLKLERKADDKGIKPEKPSAICIKNRLSVFITDPTTGELEAKPALPPRLSVCTPEKIRWYLKNPPDYAKLKKEERVPDESMSDDEKLQLQAFIAEQNAIAATGGANKQAEVNEAANIRLRALAMQQNGVASGQTPIATTQTNDSPSEGEAGDGQQKTATEGSTVNPVASEAPVGSSLSLDSADVPAVPMATVEQLSQMKALKEQLKISDEIWKAAIAKRGVRKARELTFQQADEFLANLEKKLQSIPVANGLDTWANQNAGITPPFDVPATQPA